MGVYAMAISGCMDEHSIFGHSYDSHSRERLCFFPVQLSVKEHFLECLCPLFLPLSVDWVHHCASFELTYGSHPSFNTRESNGSSSSLHWRMKSASMTKA